VQAVSRGDVGGLGIWGNDLNCFDSHLFGAFICKKASLNGAQMIYAPCLFVNSGII